MKHEYILDENSNLFPIFLNFDFNKYFQKEGNGLSLDKITYTDKRIYNYLIENECIYIDKTYENNYIKTMKPDNILSLSIIIALSASHLEYSKDIFNNITLNIKNKIPVIFESILKNTNGYVIFREQYEEILKTVLSCSSNEATQIRRNIIRDVNMDRLAELFCNKGCKKFPAISISEFQEVFTMLSKCKHQFVFEDAVNIAQKTYKAAYIDFNKSILG